MSLLYRCPKLIILLFFCFVQALKKKWQVIFTSCNVQAKRDKQEEQKTRECCWTYPFVSRFELFFVVVSFAKNTVWVNWILLHAHVAWLYCTQKLVHYLFPTARTIHEAKQLEDEVLFRVLRLPFCGCICHERICIQTCRQSIARRSLGDEGFNSVFSVGILRRRQI